MRLITMIFFPCMLVIITLGTSGCSSMPSCCVISSPKINLTGEKTVVERQIVGEYREIEKDSWVISSVKTTVQRSGGTGTAASGDPELFLALKVRDFHLDKIRKYKDRGILGETSAGYVQYMKSDEIEKDKKGKDLLQTLMDNENGARKQIFTRTLFLAKNKQPSADEIAAFGKIFSQEQRAMAQKNDWVQDDAGRWVKK